MRRWIIYSFVVICLLACGGNDYRAPVEERRPKPKPVPASYSVQRGDTLFSIAWRYGLDYRWVAVNNRILAPYTIYPGQIIYLGQKPPHAAKKTTPSTSQAKPSSSINSKSSGATGTKSTARTVKPSAPATSKTSGSTATNKAITRWRWPSSGRVTRAYSSTVHKGIDIDGKRGDAISAVAAGTVVYAGTGIVGYGELLIVKHNEVYLSAYGHNDRLLVSEGDRVNAGQKIAEKGSSGTDTVKLHFEIRKEGKPIDPKNLLPGR